MLPNFLSFILLAILFSLSRCDRVIKLADGSRIVGFEHKSANNLLPTCHVYLGIRYASLGGSRRFSHSVASFFYTSPTSIQAKRSFGPSCPQPPRNGLREQSRKKSNYQPPFVAQQMNEDCLTLNIYVPQVGYLRDRSKPSLPVVLFLSAESYEHGTANAYDLSTFAGFTEAVSIAVNVRLGLLGFLALNGGFSNGNFALLDLNAALVWVHANIAHFGGNPNQITLMGYRHGGALLHLYSLSNLARGPHTDGVKKIVLFDGTALAPWATIGSPSRLTTRLAKHFNVSHKLIELPTNDKSSMTKKSAVGDSSLFGKRDETRSANSKHSHRDNANHSMLTISEQLFGKLKKLSLEQLLEVQQSIASDLLNPLIGPSIPGHFLPDYLTSLPLPNCSNAGNSTHLTGQHCKPRVGQSELSKDRVARNTFATTLFPNTNLIVVNTKSYMKNVYEYLYEKFPNGGSVDQILEQFYPINQMLAQLLEHNYVDEFSSERLDNIPVKFQNSARLLFDVLYLTPMIQTLQLHQLMTRSNQSRYFALVGRGGVESDDVSSSKVAADLLLGSIFTHKSADTVQKVRVQNFLTFLSSFIHYGNPNQKRNIHQLTMSSIKWPKYTLIQQSYISFGVHLSQLHREKFTTTTIKDVQTGLNYRKHFTNLWSSIIPRLIGLPGVSSQWRPAYKSISSLTYFLQLHRNRYEFDAADVKRKVDNLLLKQATRLDEGYPNSTIHANQSITSRELVTRRGSDQFDRMESEFVNGKIATTLQHQTTEQLSQSTTGDKNPVKHAKAINYHQSSSYCPIDLKANDRSIVWMALIGGLTLVAFNVLVCIGIYYCCRRNSRLSGGGRRRNDNSGLGAKSCNQPIPTLIAANGHFNSQQDMSRTINGGLVQTQPTNDVEWYNWAAPDDNTASSYEGGPIGRIYY